MGRVFAERMEWRRADDLRGEVKWAENMTISLSLRIK
jgi:SH3-like domain-containing protein